MATKEKRIKRSTYVKSKQRVRDAREAQRVIKTWEEVVQNTAGVDERQVVAVVVCEDGRTRVEIEVGAASAAPKLED